MAALRLTKQELRNQKNKLVRLQTYLPTLQLKKSLLQAEVLKCEKMISILSSSLVIADNELKRSSYLLGHESYLNISNGLAITSIITETENIVGSEVPVFKGVEFDDFNYSLVDTPFWWDSFLAEASRYAELSVHLKIENEKLEILSTELRSVSIRVNLFEKKLMPQAIENIRKIDIILGDRALASMGQVKIAKKKINERKKLYAH